MCLVARYVLKGVYKNLNILVGLIFGYILSIIFTVAGIAPMVDFSGIQETIDQVGFFSIPKLVFFTSHKPVFNLGSFLTIAIVFLVSAAETTGATTAVCTGALGRDLKMEELQGSLAVDGFSSAISGCTVMMFGSIMYEGIKMLKNCEFNDRTMIIVSLSFCIGVGLTQTSGNFFSTFPKEVGDIFNGNAVAGVFVVSLLLSLLLPKKKQAN